MPSRSHAAPHHGMHGGRTQSTRHHLTRTVPLGEAEPDPTKDGHATERLRHLRRDYELDDRFRQRG